MEAKLIEVWCPSIHKAAATHTKMKELERQEFVVLGANHGFGGLPGRSAAHGWRNYKTVRYILKSEETCCKFKTEKLDRSHQNIRSWELIIPGRERKSTLLDTGTESKPEAWVKLTDKPVMVLPNHGHGSPKSVQKKCT